MDLPVISQIIQVIYFSVRQCAVIYVDFVHLPVEIISGVALGSLVKPDRKMADLVKIGKERPIVTCSCWNHAGN